jgi:DNA-binding FadR family transcriptional regulator
MPALLDDTSHGIVLKEQLASALKQVIVTGRLHAGQRVVETAWPQEFSVAQACVREAINLLITEGFLVKDSGRSARVVNYREHDVRHIRVPGSPVLAEIGAKFLLRYLGLFRSASSRASKDRTPGSATCRITVWCCT